MSRLIRTTHSWMWVVWAMLFSAFCVKYVLIMFGTSPKHWSTVSLNLFEDGCWIVLQPLSSVMWIQRHWHQISLRQKAFSWIFFIVPAVITFMVFSYLVGETIRMSVPDSPQLKVDGLELVLEGFWLYFPMISLISWFIFKSSAACPAQRWNCRYLFTPATVSLAIVGLLHMFVFSAESNTRQILGIIEECLWIYIPLLGNLCSIRDIKRTSGHRKS